MTAVPDPTVTDRAVEAAAEALYDQLHSFVGIPVQRAWADSHPDEQQQWRDDVQPVLAAAVPVLLEALADETYRDAPAPMSEWSPEFLAGYVMGISDATDYIRSAAGRWDSDE